MTSQSWFPRTLIVLSFAVVVAGSGCSFPTSSPEWDSRWVVPSEGTAISVAELLPAGVTVDPGGTIFDVTVDPFSFSRTLGEACGPCGAAQGMTVPKPAFTFDMGQSSSLPADVVSVNISTASVQVRATNGFDFDPIRPTAGVFGTITVRLYDGDVTGRLLDELVIDGAAEGFTPGGTSIWTLNATGVVGSIVTADVIIDSPAGDPVTIDNATSLDVQVVPQQVEVLSVDVDIDGRGVTIDPVSLDVEDIDQEIVDRVNGGELWLNVDNPFGVSVQADLTVGTVQKPNGTDPPIVLLPTVPQSGGSDPGPDVRIAFNQDEIRSILGQPGVTLSGTGVIQSTGPVTIRPDQVLTIESQIQVDLSFGG